MPNKRVGDLKSVNIQNNMGQTTCFYKKNMRENELKWFVPIILQDFIRKITLGTSDAWFTCRLSHQPSEPAFIL